MMTESEAYRTLGLEPGASADEVKEAFRKAAFWCHPDRNPGNKFAEEAFKRCCDARDVLLGASRFARPRGGERGAQERSARERVAREQARRNRAEREEAERQRAERQQAERQQAEREQAEREQAERERAERERAERERAEQGRTKWLLDWLLPGAVVLLPVVLLELTLYRQPNPSTQAQPLSPKQSLREGERREYPTAPGVEQVTEPMSPQSLDLKSRGTTRRVTLAWASGKGEGACVLMRDGVLKLEDVAGVELSSSYCFPGSASVRLEALGPNTDMFALVWRELHQGYGGVRISVYKVTDHTFDLVTTLDRDSTPGLSFVGEVNFNAAKRRPSDILIDEVDVPSNTERRLLYRWNGIDYVRYGTAPGQRHGDGSLSPGGAAKPAPQSPHSIDSTPASIDLPSLGVQGTH
jgi:curved DNA-binding protein CbpA